MEAALYGEYSLDKLVVLAIDPGITTGIAYTDITGKLRQYMITDLPITVLNRVQLFRDTQAVVVIEDFVGAGPRTKEAIHVLKLVGGVTAVCYLFKIRCVIQVPQQRKPLLYEAVKRAPVGTSKHVIDAYAHALAYIEREVRHGELIS
jgi:hypothetical protein